MHDDSIYFQMKILIFHIEGLISRFHQEVPWSQVSIALFYFSVVVSIIVSGKNTHRFLFIILLEKTFCRATLSILPTQASTELPEQFTKTSPLSVFLSSCYGRIRVQILFVVSP